jgi:HEAT repeat protein
MVRPLLRRVSLPLCALLLAGSAWPQADGHFSEAIAAYQQGDLPAAIEHLKAVLAENPGSEEALALWDGAEKQVVTRMLLERGELGALADRFLGLARAARREVTEDPGNAREAVQRVLEGDAVERERALLELRGTFGPWAVPALVGPLGDRGDADNRVDAIQALVRLGSDAVMPLVAVLQSDDVTTRRNAAAVLGTLGDPRAAAALAFMARNDEDDTTRAVAAEALDKLNAPSADPVGLARGLAEGWLRGDLELVQPWSGAAITWHWADGALTGRRVLAGLYHLEVAEQTARQGLAHGGSDDLRPVLAAVAAAKQAEIVAAGRLADMEGNELLAAAQEGLPAVERNLALAGSHRGKGLMLCLSGKRRQVQAAQAMMAAMGASAEERTALRAALQDPDSAVASAAAMALARQGESDAPVVARLAAALSSAPDRLVASIGQTGLAGGAPGWQLVASENPAEGLLRAKMLPPKDVIVVQDGVGGVTLDTLVFGLKNDPRTSGVPLVIVTQDVEGVQALYGDKAARVVAAASFTDVAQVAGERDPLQADLVARARQAAAALAALPASVSRSMSNEIARALAGTADDGVRAALLRLVAHAAIEQALPAVESIVVDDGASAELRKEALLAAARLWAVTGGTAQDPAGLAEVLAALVESGDEQLSLPAAQALGQQHAAAVAAVAGALQ